MQPNNDQQTTVRKFWTGFAWGASIIVLASLFALPSFFSNNEDERSYAFLGLGFAQLFAFAVVFVAASVAGLAKRPQLALGLLAAELLPLLTCGLCTISGRG